MPSVSALAAFLLLLQASIASSVAGDIEASVIRANAADYRSQTPGTVRVGPEFVMHRAQRCESHI